MEIVTLKSVREQIKREHGVSYDEFYKRIDCPKSTWNRIEKGMTRLTVELANRIAREFGEEYLGLLRRCCGGME